MADRVVTVIPARTVLDMPAAKRPKQRVAAYARVSTVSDERVGVRTKSWTDYAAKPR